MFSCREAAWLSSVSLDRSLTLWERVKLRTHLFLCSECDRCDDQVRSLDAASKNFEHYLDRGDRDGAELSEEARRRIVDAIDKEKL